MSLSTHQLVGKLSKNTFLLDEKVKFLDFAKGNSNFECRKLAEIFRIEKTAAANILKEEKSIRREGNVTEKLRICVMIFMWSSVERDNVV